LRASNLVVQSLWIGDHLSTMERLSISSYLFHGHEFHLYVYGDVAEVPEGAVVKDAREIVPQDDIKKFQSLANFSDWFRYHLLFKMGGWWVDLDTVCLQPFDFEEEHAFVAQNPDDRTVDHVCAGWIKAPVGSSVMLWCLEQCRQVDWKTMGWSELGPNLITKAVKHFHLPFQPSHLFNPLPKIQSFINGASRIPDGCFSVHLGQSAWSGIWTGKEMDKDASYPPGSIYEQLKRKYLLHEDSEFDVRYEEVTVVILSLGRKDLLGHTLSSFKAQNSYPIKRMVIIENLYDWTFSIETPWVFHLRDGWLFTASGFIEESMAILRAHPAFSTVSLRGTGPDKPSHDFYWRKEEFDGSPGLWRAAEYERFRDRRVACFFKTAVLPDMDFVRQLGNIR
jgi:hypothetical protein